MMRRGDFYPGAGGSKMLDLAPGGEAFNFGPRLMEGQAGIVGDSSPRVTPSLSSGGSRIGQFTLAEATIGLLALIGFIVFMDRKVL